MQVTPRVIIQKPVAFPYRDSKRENLVNVSKKVQEMGFYTCSGKRYDTPAAKTDSVKGKSMMESMDKVKSLINEPVTEKEAKELLKFLKHSEYSVVEQLHKQLARISVTTRCKGYTLPGVLIDNGSALNVLPLSTLNRLPLDSSHMKPCQNIVRAFDGIERGVMGRIEIPLLIGPITYEVDFLLMDIKPSYNFLLERPWIHSVGVVPSTLHQKLKLVTEGRLVTINAEEDIIATVTSSAPYLEANDEAIEWFKPDMRQRKKELKKKQERRRARLSGKEIKWEPMIFPHISKTFVFGGIIHPEQGTLENSYINATSEERTRRRNLSDIRPFEPGSDFEDDEDCGLSPDLLRMVEQEEKKILPHEETIEVMTLEEEKAVKIGTCITKETRRDLVDLLQEFKDVFAWSYQDMSGLSTDIFVHRLPIKEDCKLVQQRLRRMRPDTVLKTKEEVKKQFDAGFLQVVKYSEWVANIVPVPKKDGKWTNAAGYSLLSFMDGFSGYNQIKIHPEDMEKITFVTMWEMFCYKVMPFGLKNAEATYKRAMVTLFHDMMHKEIEVYVDDMIAKSRTEKEHVQVLRKLFLRLRKFQLKLNPVKCTFEARSGKLLGFVVSEKGIEVDPDKKCDPIFRLLKKHNPGVWDEESQKTFDKVKQYLSNAPMLTPPNPDKPLILYLTVLNNSMGCVLGQHDESRKKKKAIYYLSKKFTECKTRYSSIEKLCCALVWTTQRLRQYMLYHTTWLISKLYPLKYMMESITFNGRMARWQILLSEFDIIYVNQKAVKGSEIVNFLASRALEDYEPLDFDFPNEDLMYVAATGEDHYLFTCKLDFDCTNNMAKYEACIMGIRAAIECKIRVLEVYGDSALVIYQLKGEWETRDPKLVDYKRLVQGLIKEFNDITFSYLPRDENQMADALATLASIVRVNKNEDMKPIQMSIYGAPAHCYNIEEKEKNDHPWYHDILQYVKNREYPDQATENDKRTLRRLACDYVLDGEILYKRGKDQVLLRCMDVAEAKTILEEVHEGVCGTHANGFMMARQIMRFEYFWSTMERDCIDYAKKCHKCQIYGDKIHAPPLPLHVMTSPWPFSMWGMDVIGLISPKASNGHRFIFMVIDYFIKWVEATSYANVTKSAVSKFLKKEIICRYGRPERIISDNALNLNNNMITNVCRQFKIRHHNSSPYRPKKNGAVEAANKNIKRVVGKMTETCKDWHEKLPFSLFAYRTSVRTSTGATPFFLVYGMEVVLPIEVEISSLRVLSELKLDEAE
ncbi:gag/pol polyprotein [Gossypium australe]|uniref:RNA-directed DNA polymerase n=1 Tax=Gossypium australe TaxID=47621 RepID=A0A5B6UFZ7_9ROSI|nr:gag/pol polyprotein [Gossypium australe]